MSRIGKLPVKIPSNVKVNLTQNKVDLEGPKGKQSIKVDDSIKVEYKDNQITLTPLNEEIKTNSKHGLYRMLINNAVIGITNGYTVKMQIIGTGYKSAVEGKSLVLNVGYSKPRKFIIPDGIKISVDNNVNILIEGSDKQKVGQVAVEIRSVRPPEPYKGKGIKYLDETIRRKAGKSAKK